MQNTPWKAIYDMLTAANDEPTIERLSYYMIKLYGISDISTLLEYSNESTSVKALQRYYISEHLFREHEDVPPIDDARKLATNLVKLVAKLMVQYAYNINGKSEDYTHDIMTDENIEVILNSNDKFTRHYIGSPKGGVVIYRCGCCGNIFANHDSLLPSKEFTKFVNSVYMDSNNLPICEMCSVDIQETMDSKDVLSSSYLRAVVNIKKVVNEVGCISIAPPDDVDYSHGTCMHSYKPEGGNDDGCKER